MNLKYPFPMRINLEGLFVESGAQGRELKSQWHGEVEQILLHNYLTPPSYNTMGTWL